MSACKQALAVLGLTEGPGRDQAGPTWASSKLYDFVAVLGVVAVIVNLLDGLHSAWDLVELVVGVAMVWFIGSAAVRLRRAGR